MWMHVRLTVTKIIMTSFLQNMLIISDKFSLEKCIETEGKCVAGLSFADYINYVNSTQFS